MGVYVLWCFLLPAQASQLRQRHHRRQESSYCRSAGTLKSPQRKLCSTFMLLPALCKYLLLVFAVICFLFSFLSFFFWIFFLSFFIFIFNYLFFIFLFLHAITGCYSIALAYLLYMWHVAAQICRSAAQLLALGASAHQIHQKLLWQHKNPCSKNEKRKKWQKSVMLR